jgi:transcriptional regulator with XRE-family HTH domain
LQQRFVETHGAKECEMPVAAPNPPSPRIHLTEARTQRKLSQQQVAERVGTTFVNISRWERGITRPGAYFRRKLCILFRMTTEELDLEPGYWRLPAGPPAPATATLEPGHQVEPGSTLHTPAPPRLIGRDHVLAQLRQRLLEDAPVAGTAVTVALHGIPGVGKSALAAALAQEQEIQARYPDGVLWVELGPAPHIPELARQWGTALGIAAAAMDALQDKRAWFVALHSALVKRRMLLVIDDVWGQQDALYFMPGDSGSAHLVTTRFPGIASALDLHNVERLVELGEEDGLALLKRLAPQLPGLDADAARGIVRSIGGLPLAIVQIGAYLQAHTSHMHVHQRGAIRTHLKDVRARFLLGERGKGAEDPAGQCGRRRTSLQAAIAPTILILDDTCRAALRSLARFPAKPESFTEEAAIQACGCDLATIDELFDAGLLEYLPGGEYTLHPIIADYARTFL